MKNSVLQRLVLGIGFAVPIAAFAADVTTNPRADLRVEHNDNLRLDPVTTPESDQLGFIAELDLLTDIATPRGETLLRPRVRFQEYPDRADFERFEGFFDMLSRYEWERSEFRFSGNFAHQDLLSSDTAGGFDPLDPGGGDPDGGNTAGQTRTTISLSPTFEHRISERTTLGAVADVIFTRYDADHGVTTRTDYDYGIMDGYLAWQLNSRSSVSAGAYISRYETTDDNETTDAVGARVGYTHRWSETDGIEATVNYERNETEALVPVLVKESTSNFGGTLTAFRELEVSNWGLSVGRSFVPSGDNGKAIVDSFKLEYERLLSPRLSFRGAARYEARSAISELNQGSDRDFIRGDLSLRWMITQTWYVGGGYSYLWEDREQAVSDADNNRFFVNFGYQAFRDRPLGDLRGD